MEQTQIEGGEQSMAQVFVSYHWVAKNGKMNGFGNYVGQFNKEDYKEELGKFILDMEAEINKALSDKMGTDVQVRILYFR